MKQSLLHVSFSVAALLAVTPAEARKKKPPEKPEKPPAIDAAAEIKVLDKPAAPPPVIAPVAPVPGAGVGADVSVGVTAPLPAMPAMPPPPPPQMVVVGQRKFWEVAAAGGGVIGGAYVLSALVGALSYAGFYDGQWGWFVPVAGPALAMAGVGGEPAGCLSKAAYTYSLGPILTLIYVGGIATAITGAFVKKDVMGPAPAATGGSPAAPQPPAFQIAPTVGPSGAGMLILGTF
jgi:hypothetical protein